MPIEVVLLPQEETKAGASRARLLLFRGLRLVFSLLRNFFEEVTVLFVEGKHIEVLVGSVWQLESQAEVSH